MKNRKSGFSLVELMTCIAILTTLMSISTPYFYVVQESIIFRREISKLVWELYGAKMIAVKSNCYVVFKVRSDGYMIFVDNGEGGGVAADWIHQKNEKLIMEHQFPTTIHITTTFSKMRTRFNGTMGIKAGRVVLSDSGSNKSQVVLNRTARIRVEKL